MPGEKITNPMTLDYLQSTEDETAAQFDMELPGFNGLISNLIDTFFILGYYAKQKDVTLQDGVAFFVFERYVHLPYTLKAIWLLVRSGHYPEAAILVRHLLEAFVQMRYFADHPTELVTHLQATKRVPFKKMFDQLAPGYYTHYRSLAGVAHSGIPHSVIGRIEYPSAPNEKVLTPIGCKFDSKRASYVVNQLWMVIYGFLRFTPTFFTAYEELVDADTEQRRLDRLEDVAKWRKGHRGKFAESEGWHQVSTLLFGDV